MKAVCHFSPFIFQFVACRANQKSSNTLSGNNGTIPNTDKVQWLPVNATCQWNITVPVGKVLRINITLTFAARPCGEEYFRIHDGSSEASARLIEFTCNSNMVNYGSYIYSSGPSLRLEVKTGIVNNSTSMHLTFQALEKQGKLYSRGRGSSLHIFGWRCAAGILKP